MSVRREVLFNFATYFGPKIASLGIFAVIVPAALNALGKDRYAVLMTILLFVGFVPLLDTGISYALTFRYSRALRRDRRGGISLLQEHWKVYIMVAVVLFLIAPFAFFWLFHSARSQFGDELMTSAVAGAVAVFFMLLSGYYRAILVASGKSYVMNMIDFVSDLLRGVAIGVGATLYQNLGVTMALIAVAFAVRWLLMGGAAKRLLNLGAIIHKGRVRMRSMRVSAKIGVPYALSALLTVVFGALDKAVIARMKSLSDLAVYSLSYDITTKGWVLVWAVNSALLPVLMRMGHAGEDGKIARIFTYTWISVAAIALMVYLPLNLFEPQLVGWWVGEQMATDTRSYIAMFSLASLFYFAVCVFYNFFQAAGRVMVIAKAYFIGLLFYLSVVALGVVKEKALIIASAHLVLWVVVSAVLAYFFMMERHRKNLASNDLKELDSRRSQ